MTTLCVFVNPWEFTHLPYEEEILHSQRTCAFGRKYTKIRRLVRSSKGSVIPSGRNGWLHFVANILFLLPLLSLMIKKATKWKKQFKTLSFCVSVLLPRLERYLLWKAARKARKLKADGVIIDNKMISEWLSLSRRHFTWIKKIVAHKFAFLKNIS